VTHGQSFYLCHLLGWPEKRTRVEKNSSVYSVSISFESSAIRQSAHNKKSIPRNNMTKATTVRATAKPAAAAKSTAAAKTQQKRKYDQGSAKLQIVDLIEKNLGEPALKRVARRAGCTRINKGCFSELRKFAFKFLDNQLAKSNALRVLGRRKTLTLRDVILAARFGKTKIL
jgi:histone H3/H4